MSREVRKTVTVLFCDVVGSTGVGEALDPEALRAVRRATSTRCRRVERHGGTVEKFIGDAVMAVFGVPAVHEDDALRAVRAAAEIADALDALNDELEPLGVRSSSDRGQHRRGRRRRPGGSDSSTGDAVNVAARLEQAAAARRDPDRRARRYRLVARRGRGRGRSSRSS